MVATSEKVFIPSEAHAYETHIDPGRRGQRNRKHRKILQWTFVRRNVCKASESTAIESINITNIYRTLSFSTICEVDYYIEHFFFVLFYYVYQNYHQNSTMSLQMYTARTKTEIENLLCVLPLFVVEMGSIGNADFTSDVFLFLILITFRITCYSLATSANTMCCIAGVTRVGGLRIVRFISEPYTSYWIRTIHCSANPQNEFRCANGWKAWVTELKKSATG